jgi:hypothetical protein
MLLCCHLCSVSIKPFMLNVTISLYDECSYAECRSASQGAKACYLSVTVKKSFVKWTQDTQEPMMFPLSKLILSIAQDEHTKKETLTLVKPLLEQVSRSSLS